MRIFRGIENLASLGCDTGCWGKDWHALMGPSIEICHQGGRVKQLEPIHYLYMFVVGGRNGAGSYGTRQYRESILSERDDAFYFRYDIINIY